MSWVVCCRVVCSSFRLSRGSLVCLAVELLGTNLIKTVKCQPFCGGLNILNMLKKSMSFCISCCLSRDVASEVLHLPGIYHHLPEICTSYIFRRIQASYQFDNYIAGPNIRSSDFWVGRFSPQKWETLNLVFFNLLVLIVFLNWKSRHAVGVAQHNSLWCCAAGHFCATRSRKNESDLTNHLLYTARAMTPSIILVHTQWEEVFCVVHPTNSFQLVPILVSNLMHIIKNDIICMTW